MRILALETSCDETAAAILQYEGGAFTVLSNTVSSQASLHAKWGGVVPDLASREHIRNIVPVIEETLSRADLSPANIDLIAVTQGPGLMPALLIGITAAKTLSFLWHKPLIGIQHLEGHIYANFLRSKESSVLPPAENIFPLVALVVSGGHTELVLMRNHFQYEILGETQDDAAGEAFDKVAKLLDLPYPGGPAIERAAATITEPAADFSFPRPMIDSDDYHFSFSGLKTAVLYFVQKHRTELTDEKFRNQVCYQFQEAVIDVLVTKTRRALTEYAPHTFVIAGGVSANTALRERLRQTIAAEFPQTNFLTPELAYSLDNAAMIGAAAAIRYDQLTPEDRAKLATSFITLEPNANLPLQSLV